MLQTLTTTLTDAFTALRRFLRGRKVAQLRHEEVNIRCWHDDCRHRAVTTKRMLAFTYGANTRVDDVTDRMRAQCQRSNCRLYVFEHEVPDV